MQVKHLLGIEIPRGNRLIEVVYNLATDLHELQWVELVMGCTWLLLLHLIRQAPRWHRCSPLRPWKWGTVLVFSCFHTMQIMSLHNFLHGALPPFRASATLQGMCSHQMIGKST